MKFRKWNVNTKIGFIAALFFTAAIALVALYSSLVTKVYKTQDFFKCLLVAAAIWIIFFIRGLQRKDFSLEKIKKIEFSKISMNDENKAFAIVSKVTTALEYVAFGFAGVFLTLAIVRKFSVNFLPVLPQRNWFAVAVILAVLGIVFLFVSNFIDDSDDELEYSYIEIKEDSSKAEAEEKKDADSEEKVATIETKTEADNNEEDTDEDEEEDDFSSFFALYTENGNRSI